MSIKKLTTGAVALATALALAACSDDDDDVAADATAMITTDQVAGSTDDPDADIEAAKNLFIGALDALGIEHSDPAGGQRLLRRHPCRQGPRRAEPRQRRGRRGLCEDRAAHCRAHRRHGLRHLAVRLPAELSGQPRCGVPRVRCPGTQWRSVELRHPTTPHDTQKG